MPINYFFPKNQEEKDNVLNLATSKFDKVLHEALSLDKKVLLLLSGGSCLSLLEKVNTDKLSSSVTVAAPLDERFSTDPKESNMSLIMATEFYKKARGQGVNVFDTRVREGETQAVLAERFNCDLNDWLKKNPDGIIIATVGIGPDGHTSGMMPFPEAPEKFKELFEGDDETKLVTGYDATGKNPYPFRITTTMNLMRKIDTAIVYAAGENKREALTRLMDPKADLASTPAAILKEIPGDVYLFTDLTDLDF